MKTPYPGLRPFRKKESDLFKGRHEQIEKLYKQLINNRFIAVIGASGCGKSSLVEAGLLPRLEKNSFNTSWRVAKLRPGSRPIRSLSHALLDKDALAKENAGLYNRSEYFYAKMKMSTFGLIEIIQETTLPVNTNLLIIVDQFEEIFRSMHFSDNREVHAFVYLLIEAIKQIDIPLFVLITMRSDFIGDCASFYNFAELVGENIFLTPRLKLKQLREIITLPAENFGTIVEPSLVAKLINDMNSSQDQLPVLQHALMRMWFCHKQEKKKITLEDYKTIGTLKNCLSTHANKLYSELNSDQQDITCILFKCLVEHSKNHGDIRRTITLKDAAKIAMVDENVLKTIVDLFSQKHCNFLTYSKTDKVIDITHESLIRQWDKLIQWKNEEKETASTYFEIIKKEKVKDYLVKLSLEKALIWKEGTIPNKYWAERYNEDFERDIYFEEELLEKNLKIEDKKELNEVQTEHKKTEQVKYNKDDIYVKIIQFINESKTKEDNDRDSKEKQVKRSRNWFIFSFIIIFLLTFVVTIMYFKLEKEQTIKTLNIIQPYIKHASLQAKANNFEQARSIINESKLFYNNISSERLFTIGLLEWYFNYLSSAPLEKYQVGLGRQIFPFTSAITNDGHYILVGTNDGKIYKYDLFDKRLIYKFVAHKFPITNLAIHPKNKWIISSSNDGNIKFWSFDDHYLHRQWTLDEYKIDNDLNETLNEVYYNDSSENNMSLCMKLSPDGNFVAYGNNAIMIKSTDAKERFLLKKPLYPQYTIDRIAFTNDSKYIAIASFNEVYIKKLNLNNDIICDNELKRNFYTNDQIIGLSFHPTEPLLSITTSEKTHIFDYKHEKYRYEIPTVGSDISWSGFDHHGNLVSTALDKKIFVQNENDLILKVLQGHNHSIENFIQCKDFCFSIDRSGLINKWKLYSNEHGYSKQYVYENEPIAAKISSDISKCLIVFSSGKILMKNLLSNEELWAQTTTQDIVDISYSHDLHSIAHVNRSKRLVIRNALDGKITHQKNLKLIPSDCTFSPDCHYLTIAFEKGIFGIYNLLTKNIQYFPDKKEINQKQEFNAISYNNDGDKLITSSRDGFVKIWKAPDWKKFNEFSVSNDSINFSIFRGSYKQLICGGMDQQLYLIYEESSMIVPILSHEKEIVNAILFPGNQQLLSVGKDRTLRVYDFPLNTELFRLELPIEKFDNPVNDLDLRCKNNKCVAAVALKNKIVFYRFY